MVRRDLTRDEAIELLPAPYAVGLGLDLAALPAFLELARAKLDALLSPGEEEEEHVG